MTQRASTVLTIAGIAVMVTTLLSMTVLAVHPCPDSLGSTTANLLTSVQGSLSAHQGETERPFSHEFPALEASLQASTLIVTIGSEHSIKETSTVLVAEPDLPSEFRSSPPKSNSIRPFVLRI